MGQRPDPHRLFRAPGTIFRGTDHPRALLQHSAKKAIAYDLIRASAPIRRLYESDDLTGFIAAVLGKQVLYRSADPLDALESRSSATATSSAGTSTTSEVSVTVMYADIGGGRPLRLPSRAAPRARRATTTACREVLLGDPARVVRLPRPPGTLAGVPRPARPLHRVTGSAAARSRINSVLTYGERPGISETG